MTSSTFTSTRAVSPSEASGQVEGPACGLVPSRVLQWANLQEIAAARAADLEVWVHPLMVLTSLAPAPALPPGITVRLVSPGDPELDRFWAVPAVAFHSFGS